MKESPGGAGTPGPAFGPCASPAGPWGELAFLLMALTAAYFGCLQPVWDPDSYWHLAVGKEMWRTGGVLRAETFSFEASATPWDDTNWLAHLFQYRVWDAARYRGAEISVAVAGLLAALFAYLGTRARGGSALLFGLCITVWMTAFRARFRFRPEALSLVVFAILVWMLLAGLPPRAKPKPWLYWTLPALFLLWVQIHGGWAFGMLLVGVASAGRWLDGPGERASRLREAVLLTVPACACLFLNPYGDRVALFPFSHLAGLGNPELVKVSEWGSSPWTLSTAPFLFATLGLWAWSLFRALRRGPAWTDFFWVTSQAVLIVIWVRYCSFGWLALAPMACLALQEASLKIGRPVRSALGFLVLALAVRLTIGGVSYSPTEMDQPQNYPVLETKYLQARRLSGNLFHTFVSGGYLNFQYYPLGRTFFDGRYFPFAPFLRDYDRSATSPDRLSAFLRRYPFEIAVVPYSLSTVAPPEGPPRPLVLAVFSSDGWKPAYYGPYGTVFLRDLPRFRAVLDRDAFHLYFPGDEAHLFGEVIRGTLDGKALRAEVDRALTRGLPARGPSPALEFRDALLRWEARKPAGGDTDAPH